MNYPVISSEQTPLEQFLSLISEDAQREDVMMVATTLGLPPDDPALPLLVAAGWYRSLLCEIPKDLQTIVSQFSQTNQQGIQRIAQILKTQTDDIEQTKTALSQVLSHSLQNFEQSYSNGITALNDAKKSFREDAKIVIQHSNKISDTAQSVRAELKKLTFETQRLRDVSHHLNTKAAFALAGMGLFMGSLLTVIFYQTGPISEMNAATSHSEILSELILEQYGSLDTMKNWSEIRQNCIEQQSTGAEFCRIEF